jgi:hypothetical protein
MREMREPSSLFSRFAFCVVCVLVLLGFLALAMTPQIVVLIPAPNTNCLVNTDGSVVCSSRFAEGDLR